MEGEIPLLIKDYLHLFYTGRTFGTFPTTEAFINKNKLYIIKALFLPGDNTDSIAKLAINQKLSPKWR